MTSVHACIYAFQSRSSTLARSRHQVSVAKGCFFPTVRTVTVLAFSLKISSDEVRLLDLIVRDPLPQIFEVSFKLPAHLDGVLQVLVAEPLPLILRQLPRRRDGVADLAAVHVLLDELVDVVHDVFKVDAVRVEAPEPGEEVSPDFLLLGDGQILVVEGQLDARFEGLVKRADAVGGEDEDADVVF